MKTVQFGAELIIHIAYEYGSTGAVVIAWYIANQTTPSGGIWCH